MPLWDSYYPNDVVRIAKITQSLRLAANLK